jgi:hypothetical protein
MARQLTELVDILRTTVSGNVILMMLYFAKRQYFLLEKRVSLSIKICYANSIVYTSCKLNIKFCGIWFSYVTSLQINVQKICITYS